MNCAAGRIALVAGLAFAGCVTGPPPKEDYIEASAAIRAAEELVNADVPMPDAELYLARARDHMRQGERLLEERSYERAELAFERAEVEAETAISLARARMAERAAEEAESRLGEEPRKRRPRIEIERDDYDDYDDLYDYDDRYDDDPYDD